MNKIPRAQRNMTYVPRGQYWIALSNWHNIADGKAFITYIGISSAEVAVHDSRQYLMVTKEQARKLELLTGPHHQAIIKMILIQRKSHGKPSQQ